MAGAGRAWGQITSPVAFAALAGFCAAHWVALVADPPALRTAAVVALATLAGLILGSIRGPARRPWVATVAGAAIVAGALAAGLVAMGLPARLLLPGELGELGDGLARGLGGIRTDWPYDGPDRWVRLTILLAVPPTLCAASALCFWPTGARRGRLSAAALVVLLTLYGVAAAQQDPGEPLARGALLLALIAAWVFLPRVGARAMPAAAAMVLVAGAASLPLAARLPASEPLIDYTSWRWVSEPAAFAWDHSYGPIDWPREGETLLTIESTRPHYWKIMALDRFDGLRWERSEAAASSGPDPSAPVTGSERWDTEVSVTVEGLHTDLLVTPGSVRGVEGVGVPTLTRDGAARAGDELEQATTYTVRAYAPNPSAARMRRAPELDPFAARPYTLFHLPPEEAAGSELGDAEDEAPGPPVVLPRFSDGRGGTYGAKEAVLASPYAGVYRIARRLTAGAPTAYDAVRRIEAHLRDAYDYSEEPPKSDHPLAAFLLEDPIGYCQQFSGAMALMLRMNGIPARVATGFSPGARDRDAGEFTVRDLDAHSWVEVHFTGLGWVPFDPTPPDAPAASRADETLASAARGNIGLAGLGLAGPVQQDDDGSAEGGTGGQGDEVTGDPGGGATGPGLAGAGLLLLLLVGWTTVVATRARRGLRGPDAAVVELHRALERLGHPVAPGTTLADVERRLRERGRTGAARHVRRMRVHRFGRGSGAPPDGRGRRALRAALSAGSGLRGRARGYLVLPPRLRRARPG